MFGVILTKVCHPLICLFTGLIHGMSGQATVSLSSFCPLQLTHWSEVVTFPEEEDLFQSVLYE